MSGPVVAPRVRRNEWQVLDPPPLDGWEPTLSVSVVVPAWNAGALLPIVLAGLAGQSYPEHLLEVVVVNDGPTPLELPEVRPERTRVVEVTEGWGRANACHLGARLSDGDVLHWYDADMLAERHEVEAQARWHHLLDHVVVLGARTFADPAPVLALSPGQVRAAVHADRLGEVFPVEGREPHAWTEDLYRRTDDLQQAGWYAGRAHVGMTGSVSRALYDASGGMALDLRLGEDTEIGMRLGEAGGVFVPDRASRSWHLGLSNVMRRSELVNLYNAPYLGERSPGLRARRTVGRTYELPYLDVVLDTRDHDPEQVLDVVDAVLAGTLHDVGVTLLGDWSQLDDDRVAVLDTASFGVRLVHDTYRGDARVRLLERLPAGRARSPFTMHLPGVAFAPRPRALERLVLHLEHTHDGLRLIELRDESVVRIERTAAFQRARLVAAPGESLDEVIAEVAGTATLEHRAAGFGPTAKVRPKPLPRTGGPAVDSAEAWARVDRATGPG